MVIFSLAAVAANIGLSIYAIGRTQGIGRFLAGLPLLGLIGIGLYIVIGVSQVPTSHNLWPFELLIACAAGILYSAVFLGLQGRSRAKPAA